MLRTMIVLLVAIFIVHHSFAQENHKNDSLRKDALNIYLDCIDCPQDYIRQEITFVNYVRDQKDAQLYIMETSQATGSGGTEFTLTFIGRKEFAGKNDTLKFSSGPNDTEDEIRKAGVRILKMGLMRYVAKTPLAEQISIGFESTAAPDKVVDPWKSWVFNINGSGYFNGQESIKSTNIYSYFDASKITENIKIDMTTSYNYYEAYYKIDDTTTIKSYTNSKSFYGLIVKSLSEHWSAGGTTNINTSTYSNRKLCYSLYPSVEYDLFKYSESTRRQLRFLYGIGGGHTDYIDTTIYDKIKEDLFLHTLTIAYKIKETWGSISATLYGSQYLHDFSKNNLELYTTINIRIFKGLSLSLYGDVSLIHDQLGLPKGGATEQEILTQQKQLASQYSYYGSVGLTYTFGSIYNNVVNPRFGN